MVMLEKSSWKHLSQMMCCCSAHKMVQNPNKAEEVVRIWNDNVRKEWFRTDHEDHSDKPGCSRSECDDGLEFTFKASSFTWTISALKKLLKKADINVSCVEFSQIQNEWKDLVLTSSPNFLFMTETLCDDERDIHHGERSSTDGWGQ